MSLRIRWVHGTIVPVLAALVVLTACEGIKEELGLTKKSPDEFTVVSKAPLALPPDYSLRPPRPGAVRPQEIQPGRVARSALTGNDGSQPQAAPAKIASLDPSIGENALLREVGTSVADPNIRQVVNQESSLLAEKDNSFVDRLIFWQKTVPSGQVVDASKEAARLQGNAATGESVTSGDTPTISRRKRGILEGIF